MEKTQFICDTITSMSGIKNLLFSNKNQQESRKASLDTFIDSEKSKKKLQDIYSKTGNDLFGTLSNSVHFLESHYENFILNPSIFSKDKENFYLYLKDTKHGYSQLNKADFNRIFSNLMESLIEKESKLFLASSDRKYSLNIWWFHNYIKSEKSYLLEGIPEDKIISIYQKKYEEWTSLSGKNQFWLEKEKISIHLKEVFREQWIGDWSFLYEWSTSEHNGIEKYIKSAENPLYREIKPIEEYLYKYIFSASANSYKIKEILESSNSIVELWSWWVAKLKQYLKFATWDEEIKDFINKKDSILLVDVNSDGFSEVKKDLNRITGNAITEWIEADFRNPSSSAYTLDNPMYFMFWGTIGNFTSQEIGILLENMKPKHVLKNSHFGFTYFHGPDENQLSQEKYDEEVNKIKAMYGDNETNPFFDKIAKDTMEDLILSWLAALGIYRDILEYAVAYEEADSSHPARIKLGAKLIEDIEMKIPDGNIIKKNKGEYIWAVQSARFTRNEIIKLAKNNNYDLVVQEDHDWIGVCILKSKIALHDKYKKYRNIGYGVLTAWIILWSWLGFQKHEKNKIINNNINTHERTLNEHKTNNEMFKIENSIRSYDLSIDLTTRFIEVYGKWDMTESDIQDAMYLYLDQSVRWIDYVNTTRNPDIQQKDALLEDFVNNYFYKQMFKNWFNSLEQRKSLVLNKENIMNSLQYAWPITAWYNEADHCYYQWTPNLGRGIKIEEWLHIEEGHFTKYTGHISTIKTTEASLESNTPPSLYWLSPIGKTLITKTKPDTDGKIIVTYFVVDDWSSDEDSEYIIGIYHNNVFTTDPNALIAIIDKTEPLIGSIYTSFEQFYWYDNLDAQTIQKIKKLIIIDLYTPNQIWTVPISRFALWGTWQITWDFLGDFSRKHSDFLKTIEKNK